MKQDIEPVEAGSENNVTVIDAHRVPRFAPTQSFSLQELGVVAEAIAKGGLFGSRDYNAVLTLCMLAHAEGQHPATVFRDYNIIKGRPSKSAEAMQRDFLAAGGTIKWHRLENDGGAAEFSHPRGGSIVISWDMERARQAGLIDRVGSRNNSKEPNMWAKYPRQLFRARIISEGVRTIYPAATGGMYEPGEVHDITDGDRTDYHSSYDDTPQLSEEELRANAEEWVKRVHTRIDECEAIDALEDLQARCRQRMRNLARNAADLYQQVQRAYEAKSNALQGYDPVTGKTAAEREGDGGEEESVYAIYERRLDECRNLKDVGKVDRDWCLISAAQDDETQGLVFDMIERRRASFKSRR